MINKGLFSSKTDQWATPQEFFDELDREFHFDLDPCADESNHKTPEYFTKEQDGLLQDWSGRRVFCNPPYGRAIAAWVEKAYREGTKDGTIVVMLILRIGSMMAGNFDQVQSLLNDQVLSVGDVLDTFVYRVGVSNSRFSFASAAGLFNSAVGAVLLLASDRLAKRLGERGLF